MRYRLDSSFEVLYNRGMGSPGKGEVGVRQLHIRALAETDGELEVKQLNGRDHLVVPTIILVEGVLHASNAEHPALALAEEFGIFPQGWDGRPVVYNHPKRDGEPVSANSPDLWEGEVIGQLFGSSMKGKKKLRTYMWLDKEKTPSEVFQTLDEGGSLEVSTGLFTLEEETSGKYNSESYDVIWRNIVPDHLAVLPKGTVGACSNAAGCGAPRVNQSTAKEPEVTKPAEKPAANACQTGCVCQKCTGTKPVENSQTPTASLLGSVKANGQKMFEGFLKALGLKQNEISDVDKRTAVDAALGAINSDSWCYIMALYDNKVVYACMDDSYEWKTYSRSYSVAEGGAVSLGSDVTEVRPETRYVPLAVTTNESQHQPTEGNDMSQKPAESQKPVEQPAVTASASASAEQKPAEQKPQDVGVGAGAQAFVASGEKAKSMDELMALASPEVQAELKALQTKHNEHVDRLVKALEGKSGLTADELKKFDVQALERMAKTLVPDADFSGAAGGSVKANAAESVNNTGKIEYTPATPLFAANEAQKLPGVEKKVA